MRDDDGPAGGPGDEQTTDRRAEEPPRDRRSDPRTDDAPEPGSSGGTGDRRDRWLVYAYDLVSSVAIVVVIGGLLFTASGIWPPMVAVESPSMEPILERGDLVYVMESDRFPGPGAQGETGVVTADRGRDTGYRTFGGYGDVIVFRPGGSDSETPIIHRAMLWVEEGERWYDRANQSYIGLSGSCERLDDCPAPHDGFITKGDNNRVYDQVLGSSGRGEVVKPEWIVGTAEVSVPYLGQIRLQSAGATTVTADPANATEPAPREG